MWTALIGTIVNAGVSYFSRRQAVAEARAQAQITIAQRTAEHEASIEVEATRATANGWKDELVTIWAVFFVTWVTLDPTASDKVARLADIPVWLSSTLALIILAAAGIRRVAQVTEMTNTIRGRRDPPA